MLYLIGINMCTFFLYGYDKICAIWKKSRIEEHVLYFFAFIGGAVGALVGMLLFRHKTAKRKFYIWNILCGVLWCYLLYKFIKK